MGNKANPKVLRLGIVDDWDSVWFDLKNYSIYLFEDEKIRSVLNRELYRAGISKIYINRKSGNIEAIISLARSGIVLGKSGIDLNIVKNILFKELGKKVIIKIIDEKKPDLSSKLLGQWIAGQLERRVQFRRAMKMCMQKALKSGAEGIKVSCSGRLGGVEIARTEWYKQGKIPLHTFRAKIDYSFVEAFTTYGKIGIKVWIYKGQILNKKLGNTIESIKEV
jgi:small subunit ribosomal protein S3